jgi:arginine decarboxylase
MSSSDPLTCEEIYAIPRWGAGYFHVNSDGHLAVRPDTESEVTIDLHDLANEIQQAGLSLPVLVRFNDILSSRVKSLREVFERACRQSNYNGGYSTAYPLKVNQQRSVVEQIIADGVTGLEAGSKPELLMALTLAPPAGLVVCNGYKDREYIRLALIGRRMGLRLFMVVEKLQELELILQESRRLGVEPLLGVRVRLAASVTGNWQNSGGERAKFGLLAHQVLELAGRLLAEKKQHWLSMLHVHMGSQIPNLNDIRRGLGEAARYFAELRALGMPVDTLDVGGGLGVDYEGTGSRNFCSMNYGLDDYARAVVETLQQVCVEQGLPAPHIICESGRALTAHHSLLITNLVEREIAPGLGVDVREEDREAEPLRGLAVLLEQPEGRFPQELFESAQELFHGLRQGFETGSVGLAQRARAEELYYGILRQLRARLVIGSRRQRELLERINLQLAEKLFLNFSLFQSMPDAWAIEQVFPIVPLQRLDEIPTQRGVVHDITCDSDGCIEHYVDRDGVEATLPVHEQQPGIPYLLGIFLLGAYQEILGDIHNLFGDSDAVNLELDGNGGYQLLEPERGDSVDELLRYVHFDPQDMLEKLRGKLETTDLEPEQRQSYFQELEAGLQGYTYLED